jgi:hypothetical protein
VSERVTWEACPCCSGPAAVGWTRVHLVAGPPRETPVEFDCPRGCQPTPGELSRLIGRVMGDWRWWRKSE